MPQVRAGAAEKWKRRAAAAQQDYAAGARNPRRSWAQATQAAQPAYEAGVQQAIAQGRFGRGVQNAGDQTWQQGVQAKGVQRFAQGVQQSGDAYERGSAPYRQVIEGTNLPDRGPRGSAQNFERSRVMGQALNEARNRLKGG